jgi:hemoglobin
MTAPPKFGFQDTSFKAAGGIDGISRLVDAFYDIMDTLPQAEVIRGMHAEDLSVSRDKLARFLCGWLGGPRLFREKYGTISLTGVHSHLAVGEAERDAWLECMRLAIAEQDYASDFSIYLQEQLAVPAERVRVICKRQDAPSA